MRDGGLPAQLVPGNESLGEKAQTGMTAIAIHSFTNTECSLHARHYGSVKEIPLSPCPEEGLPLPGDTPQESGGE